MRAAILWVSKASVTVEGKVVGQIGCGLLVLLGIGVGDQLAEAPLLAEKIANIVEVHRHSRPHHYARTTAMLKPFSSRLHSGLAPKFIHMPSDRLVLGTHAGRCRARLSNAVKLCFVA
jgi:hypothetical protein